MSTVNQDSFFGEQDIHLLREGTHYRSFERMGAHMRTQDGQQGTQFSVWAPNAHHVNVVGDFNNWSDGVHTLEPLDDTGIWTGFVPSVGKGALYKYSIHSTFFGVHTMKADPYAFYCEKPPRSASVVWDIGDYTWGDASWMAERAKHNALDAPISIYEMHVGSWRRRPEEDNRSLTYVELAAELPAYLNEMGFTHVEFMPINEYPFDGSWGYQGLGYFAPTSRFGTPQDFMKLIDALHVAGIGVLVDWVPAHFATDGHGLGLFDGSHLYEHADPRKGFHPDWGSFIFNFSRNEVANFLLSSALYWFEKFHIDGIRVDAVASMLYLDYSREDGDWIPNDYGGRENVEAIFFLRRLNELIYERFPGAMSIAEESTSWPMVSRPTTMGGLGFGFKWNMGWMNDVLSYFSKDPVHRQHHHQNLTFGLLYAFHENFVLPFSHDEVVHHKGSLIGKMPGDDWQKFANLRSLYGYMYAHPGKKLLFMGCEFAQRGEWDYRNSLDWHVLQYECHHGIQLWVKDLNALLRSEPALYENDFHSEGFRWIDCNDTAQSVLSFMRIGSDRRHQIVCAFNFTPVPRFNFRLGVEMEGYWQELLNSDSKVYGGSGLGNHGGVMAEPIGAHGFSHSVSITLPPLSAVYFRLVRGDFS